MKVIYKGDKTVPGRAGAKFYSKDYVKWLEAKFKESRDEVHMMAAKRNKWKGIARVLLEELEGAE